jgi:hypothetical protein
MMNRGILLYLAAAMFSIPALNAQNATLETVNPLNPDPGGIRLQSVSVFLMYHTVSGASSGLAGTPSVDETGAGATATLGYSRFGERSGISVSYTPSYTTTWQNYATNTQNHSLSFNWRRHLTPKWTYTLAGSGVVTSLTDALFLPTALANVAAVPATFDELSAGILRGGSTNNQLAAVLTNAPVVESPSGMRLYGSRMLTSSLQSDISYSYSSRLTFHVNVAASRSQALKDSSLPAGSNPDYLLSHTMAGSGSIDIGYSLSPRTQLSAGWSSSRTFSTLEDVYTHAVSVSLAHTMSPQWFLQVHAGTAFVTAIREFYAPPNGPQYQAGGGLGYKRHAHTFLAAVDRSVSDAYGFGASASVAANGAWNWSPPGSAWSTTANFGQQWLTGTGFQAINTWRATAGVMRKAGQHIAVSAEYAYLSGSRFLGVPGSQGGQQIVRMSVVWLPSGRQF